MKRPTLPEAMRAYALNSVERFPSFDPATNAKRTGTTFYGDFMVGETGGINGLDDTWKRVWAEWKNNCEYLVELAVCLNHRCWELDNGGDLATSEWYSEKFHFVQNRIYSNGSDEEPLPEGCTPFTEAEHKFAFDVLD